ncbi:hypothetical protein AVEN_241986-1 [Araneus ventricosus]|uniref:Uncharacterized protein n=1 Tax=Araneus ventricosus TaxID=182803 RepID=A0A4Y2ECZ6_ARAVE|nr:hypothetical protein AVEN_241986-1 [Araneus ventricosus]
MHRSNMATTRWYSRKRCSESDSITSSMMSIGDEMEVPRFLFTAEDGVNELILLEESDDPFVKKQVSDGLLSRESLIDTEVFSCCTHYTVITDRHYFFL